MLELVDISKHFKKIEAVKALNMFIEQGEIVGLLGPNGAGKSTAISILSTLIEPTQGDVRFLKKSVIKKPSPLRKAIGVVPQEIALYPQLSAEENLLFFGRIYRLKGSTLKQRVNEILEQIGLTEKRKALVESFSGGMKRRLNIGVAMLHSPQILIMDEPTVGIDPQSRSYILETVKRLNKENQMTVVYTSHYMEEVDYLCDRIYIMDQGNLIASGTKEEIKQILSSENTISIQADHWSEAFIARLKDHESVTNVHVEEKEITLITPKEVNLFSEIISMTDKYDISLRSLHVKSPTLEDVFLHLTGRALRD
ncbi:ABC transporter ATP-binding protein [Oceanobacillus oncorhynchi subsp. incaldanensis]|uniref:Daunorubicin/doxorubicin resistance ATP-binding protein DrrA n=2 Tax=Oceanobacillus TaxID=182709 RepID=A0A0A1MUX4_9BACI|nr:ABC transporter ATP-binding protein [Oceanobacillus oncorhynchi]MDM8099595.1 ABC transporter ATP-binding protein [Oceanobacillus oncorhynchi]UUI41952.1 ABC transporter ATP-binding protein [Oceanobacillus oncorhynchi]GIO20056.1 ABC transporter ATP-binding protein [Oceanobacillus oncorhynchi subsp. incaldanensis]CEI83459.1 Daunorubicin/doxorubicin resistance ATP-binding protein DrrA [Oceanobacillus oncorhynchi]